MAQFSGEPRIEWHLNTHATKEAVMDASRNLPYKGGNTLTGRTSSGGHQPISIAPDSAHKVRGTRGWSEQVFFSGLALTFILENSFRPESGSRPGLPKIVVLLTDGKSQDDVIPAAQSLRDSGIEVFAIGTWSRLGPGLGGGVDR